LLLKISKIKLIGKRADTESYEIINNKLYQKCAFSIVIELICCQSCADALGILEEKSIEKMRTSY